MTHLKCHVVWGKGAFCLPPLFIKSVVARLNEAVVGVKCGSKVMSMLLYADDAGDGQLK